MARRWLMGVGAVLIAVGVVIGLTSPVHLGDTNCGNVFVDLATRPSCADLEPGWAGASVILPITGVVMFAVALATRRPSR